MHETSKMRQICFFFVMKLNAGIAYTIRFDLKKMWPLDTRRINLYLSFYSAKRYAFFTSSSHFIDLYVYTFFFLEIRSF